jgi:hypothetical protein
MALEDGEMPASDDETQYEHAMVDAIRMILGMAPLYEANPPKREAERFAAVSYSDGNRRVERKASRE